MAERKEASEIRVGVKQFGPTPDDLQAIGRRLLKNAAVGKLLGKSRSRLIGIEAIDPVEGERKPARPRPPERFRATLYDYGASRALVIEGGFARPDEVTITETASQPPVTDEEFDEAVQLVQRHGDFARQLKARELTVYRPMPPLIEVQADDGSTRRIVAVGLYRTDARRREEIFGVDLGSGELRRFDDRAPPISNPANDTMCGVPPSAGQATATKGTAGQVWITVKQGGQTLWRFLAVRPAASSGAEGSGIELRYVDYKGKRVLYRAHVPILNVKYDGNACGPYRDWQYQEGMLTANGTNVAPGFRLCPSPAKTIMQSGSDTGNFLGVAIYVDGQEVVLISELQAGWYRYVSEWRLHTNGTIRPRFGFAATYSSCVCNVHHHHAYWRLDFDIVSAGGNRVEEFNDPPLFPNTNWHQKNFEIARSRDPARKRKWRVKHLASGAAYEIRPRPEDGVASQQPDWPYGRGDVWILHYRGTEIEDSLTRSGTEAAIGNWVNGENINGQDVVVWYGAHFTHDVNHDDPATHGHVVGPDLVPVNWG